MEKQLQDFNRLTTDAAEYLRSVHGFSIRTIGHYKGGWRIIKEYMIAKRSGATLQRLVRKYFKQGSTSEAFVTCPVTKSKFITASFDCRSLKRMAKSIYNP